MREMPAVRSFSVSRLTELAKNITLTGDCCVSRIVFADLARLVGAGFFELWERGKTK